MVDLWNAQVRAGQRPATHEIICNSYPEPWVGNPLTANVLVLRLNPGHDPGTSRRRFRGGRVLLFPGDAEFFNLPEIPSLIRSNLSHEIENHYHLRPEFGARPLRCRLTEETEFAGYPGWRFWRCRALRQLVVDAGENKVRKGVAALELFPYHSTNYAFDAWFTSASLDYTRYLVLQAIEERKVIVVGLAQRQWLTLVPELLRYEFAVGQVSVAPHITPANTFMPLAPWLPRAPAGAAYSLVLRAL